MPEELRRNRLWRTARTASLALMVTACGAGGNTPSPLLALPPPPPAPPAPPAPPSDPDDFRTAEYERSWGLEAIGAADAYAQGFTGNGVTIGVFDFNFVFSTNELDLHPGSRDKDPFNVALQEARTGEPAPADEHGHAVAVVAAGLKNDFETHGVAFDAQVLAVDFFSGVNDRHVTQDGILFHVSDPWTYMTDRGIRVINLSLGFDEEDFFTPLPVTEAYTIDLDAIAVANGALLVASAGNDGDPDPMLSNLDIIDDLRANGILDSGPGAFIIAGATDENNQIASFSDRAGIAMNYYMVAPGQDVTFPWNGVLSVGSGTSFSAPHVSGAAAVIFQRWPGLTAREVANILFDSATDLGAPGVDIIYGHGLLNLDAALQPLGVASIATLGSVQPLVADSGILLGPAFGDAGGLALALSSVMMLDGFGRDFQLDLSGFASARPAGAALDDLVTHRRNWRASTQPLAGFGTGFSQVNLLVGRDQRAQELLPMVGQATADLIRDDGIILEITGRLTPLGGMAGISWAAGNGRALGDAMRGRPLSPYDAGGGALLSLTQAFSSPIPSAGGIYALAGLWLSGNTELKLGASMADSNGVPNHPVAALRRDASLLSSALRLDHYTSRSRVSLEAGILVEDAAILGTRAAGGLAITDKSRTSWLTLEAERNFAGSLTFSASLTMALTDPGVPAGSGARASIFQTLGTITSTSFSARLAGRDIFMAGDAASFTLHQPLRVESAGALMVTGQTLDPGTGDVIFAEQALSLAPSGRQIALETAYQARLGSGDWTAEANLAYRFDAGHVAGQRDVSLLLGLRRGF